MNKKIFIIASATLLMQGLQTVSAQAVSDASQHAQEWTLIWSQEFDTDGAYDHNIWTAERGFVRNHEAQWYQEENAYQKDGCLVIEARKEQKKNPFYTPDGGKDWKSEREYINYTASSLTTSQSFSFLYGRLEVRAKIPTAGGAWPAIWLLGKGMKWPSCGEIDVMEYYRIQGVPHILANVAWGNDRPYQAVWNSKKTPFSHFTEKDALWAEKFHVWRMDWTPQAIRIYLDDELLNDIPMSQTVNGSIGQHLNPFTRPQYLLLNLALGGDNGGEIDETAFPMKYEIDYVRVYQQQ
jgi:beta-glucanase (GH16 family)